MTTSILLSSLLKSPLPPPASFLKSSHASMFLFSYNIDTHT